MTKKNLPYKKEGYTKLEPSQKKEMLRMIKEGQSPQDISEYFNVAISTVHYHKGLMKKEGKNVPNVRGTRPSGIKDHIQKTIVGKKPSVSTSNDLIFNINGVRITIDRAVKAVHINADGTINVDI